MGSTLCSNVFLPIHEVRDIVSTIVDHVGKQRYHTQTVEDAKRLMAIIHVQGLDSVLTQLTKFRPSPLITEIITICQQASSHVDGMEDSSDDEMDTNPYS